MFVHRELEKLVPMGENVQESLLSVLRCKNLAEVDGKRAHGFMRSLMQKEHATASELRGLLAALLKAGRATFFMVGTVIEAYCMEGDTAGAEVFILSIPIPLFGNHFFLPWLNC